MGLLLLCGALQRLHLVLQLHDVPQLASLGPLSALQGKLGFNLPQGVLYAPVARCVAAHAPESPEDFHVSTERCFSAITSSHTSSPVCPVGLSAVQG